MGIEFENEKMNFSHYRQTTRHISFRQTHMDFCCIYIMGRRSTGAMDYLLTYYDRGFSANPYDANQDRTYSMDALPQEFPTSGTGDFRSPALTVKTVTARIAVICAIRAIGL